MTLSSNSIICVHSELAISLLVIGNILGYKTL